jgi:hypothetical protein
MKLKLTLKVLNPGCYSIAVIDYLEIDENVACFRYRNSSVQLFCSIKIALS